VCPRFVPFSMRSTDKKARRGKRRKNRGRRGKKEGEGKGEGGRPVRDLSPEPYSSTEKRTGMRKGKGGNGQDRRKKRGGKRKDLDYLLKPLFTTKLFSKAMDPREEKRRGDEGYRNEERKEKGKNGVKAACCAINFSCLVVIRKKPGERGRDVEGKREESCTSPHHHP